MTDHIPSYWNLCHVARHFKVAVAGPGVREMMEVKRVVEIEDGSSHTAAWWGSFWISKLDAVLIFLQ
jgi:hypothetical protein